MRNPKPNVSGLQSTAQRKHLEAVAKVEQGIKKLLRQGKPVNVTAVAKVSGVSRAFIHNDPEFKAQIDNLKRRQNPKNSPAAAERASNASKDALIDALRIQIEQQQKEIALLTNQPGNNRLNPQQMEQYDLLAANQRLREKLEQVQSQLARAIKDNQNLTSQLNQLKSQNRWLKAQAASVEALESDKEALEKKNNHVAKLLAQATSVERQQNERRFARALRGDDVLPEFPEVDF